MMIYDSPGELLSQAKMNEYLMGCFTFFCGAYIGWHNLVDDDWVGGCLVAEFAREHTQL